MLYFYITFLRPRNLYFDKAEKERRWGIRNIKNIGRKVT